MTNSVSVAMPLDLSYLSSPAERGKRIRILRNMTDLTIQEFANKHGIGASTIKYWECAKSEGLSPKGAKKLVEAMLQEGIYCTYMWLMHGVGIHPQFIDARYGTSKKQVDPMHSSLDAEIAIRNEMDVFLKGSANAVTLTVFEDGMEPYYCIGDAIGGSRLTGNDINFALGRDCIIETEDKQIICRRLVKGNELHKYTLCCVNPFTTFYPLNLYDVNILSAAPISRLWRRFGKNESVAAVTEKR